MHNNALDEWNVKATEIRYSERFQRMKGGVALGVYSGNLVMV